VETGITWPAGRGDDARLAALSLPLSSALRAELMTATVASDTRLMILTHTYTHTADSTRKMTHNLQFYNQN